MYTKYVHEKTPINEVRTVYKQYTFAISHYALRTCYIYMGKQANYARNYVQ